MTILKDIKMEAEFVICLEDGKDDPSSSVYLKTLIEDDKLLMEWQTMIRNITGGDSGDGDTAKNKSSIKRELGTTVEVKSELVDKKI